MLGYPKGWRMMNVRVRPVAIKDLDAIYRLACDAGYGMTNLPANKPLLEEKIQRSVSSFQKSINTPHDEIYFFVMETIDEHKIVGCAGIIALVGAQGPFFHYKVSHEVLCSDMLALCTNHQVLYIVNDYQNMSEIGMLFLEPGERHHLEGELLSRFRMLFITEYPQRFTPKIFACMRGVIDEKGNSPFWTHMGEKFINMSFLDINNLIIKGQAPYLTELLPKVPMQIALLPEVAQKSIANTHHDTKRAVEILKKEGFEYAQYIDLFDGGPYLELNVAHSYTAEHSKTAKVLGILPQVTGNKYLIAKYTPEFRACMGMLLVSADNTLVVSTQTAKALDLNEGDMVRYVAI